MYIDYEREGLAKFMTHDGAAAPLVKDSGNIVEAAYNLHGDLIQKRNQADNCCSPAPHFSTTGPDGCGCWTDIMDGGGATEPEWAGRRAEIESHDAFSRRTSRSTGDFRTGRLGDDVALLRAPGGEAPVGRRRRRRGRPLPHERGVDQLQGRRAVHGHPGPRDRARDDAHVRGRRVHARRLREDRRGELRAPGLRLLLAERLQRAPPASPRRFRSKHRRAASRRRATSARRTRRTRTRWARAPTAARTSGPSTSCRTASTSARRASTPRGSRPRTSSAATASRTARSTASRRTWPRRRTGSSWTTSTRRASRATASPARGSRARSSRLTGAGTAPSRTSSTTARGNSSTTRRPVRKSIGERPRRHA